MSEIGAVVGFLILMALLWSRMAAERREDHSTTEASRSLPWRAPQVIDTVAEGERKKAD
jgi:hypothetical protein